MKKLVLALVAAATVALAAPSFVSEASAAPAGTTARTKVVKTNHGRVVKKVVVRRGHPAWRHHGWRHHQPRATKTVTVKRPNGTIVHKRIVHGY